MVGQVLAMRAALLAPAGLAGLAVASLTPGGGTSTSLTSSTSGPP